MLVAFLNAVAGSKKKEVTKGQKNCSILSLINTLRPAEEIQVDQGKDGETNVHAGDLHRAATADAICLTSRIVRMVKS